MTFYPDARSHSAKMFERACQVMPGGNSRLTTFQLPYPIYAASGSGFRVTDADGVGRTDFINNYTSLIHGHCDPAVVAAMTEQVGRIGAVALATEAELKLAELLCARVPSFDLIRFANSGTEGVMQAIRAARAYTGRPRIAKSEGAYHGAYDYAEVSYAVTPDDWGAGDPVPVPYAKGTPKTALGEVLLLPFNDVSAIDRILAPQADQLAAVIVDLVPLSLGTIPASREFLTAIRAFTRQHGIVLIFDEVVTFRLGYRGGQDRFGVAPDLTTLGKIIGGGLPIGAVAGSKDVMSVFDARGGRPPLPHGGTFNGNPVTMAAGHAAMSLLDEAAFDRLNRLGDYARAELGRAIGLSGFPAQVTGMGSLLHLHLHDRPVTEYRSSYRSTDEAAAHAQLHRYLLNHGVLMSPHGIGALSTPMAEAQIDQLAETLLQGLREMNRKQRASA